MMKTYERYKPSGVEWIGDIPCHWELIPFKRIAKRIEVGIAEAATHAYTQEGVPILRATNIKNGRIEGNLLFIEKEFADKNKSKTIYKNDLVTVRTGNAGLSAVIPASLDGCQCFTMLITTLYQSNPHYYNYLLNSTYGATYFDIAAWGTAQKNISVPILQDFPALKISLDEQTAIVKYLDEKIARLDKLIEGKRRLIALLKEERSAVINKAVTRGINPHAKLKPSDIDWLSEIPEHWEVKQLKFVSYRIGDGIHATPVYDDNSDIFFVNGNNLIKGSIVISEMTRRVIEDDYTKLKIDFKHNTILLSINGTIGNLAFYDNEKIVLGKSAAYIECADKLNKTFAFYVLQSSYVLNGFETSLSGTTIKNLSLYTLKNTKIALPTIKEQKQIVQFIEAEAGKIDMTVAKIEKEIEYLREYRTALISEVVTGKIDVRS